MMRARESDREDRLFADPLAAAMVAASPPIFEAGPDAEEDPTITALEVAFGDVVAVRTRFFDDFATSAVADGCGQVVLVGAGLDTRAFRLDWPSGVRLFELDRAEVLRFKERVLAESNAEPRCERITVGLDLQRSDWPAIAADVGLEPNRSTAWIAEGLLPYLGNSAAESLLVLIGELSGTGSRLGLDYGGGADDDALSEARSMDSMGDIVSMWKGGLAEGAARWLARHGWHARATVGSTVSAGYDRDIGSMARDLMGTFVTASRRI